MTEVLPRDILLRVGGRTLQRTGFLAAMGAGRGYVEVKETVSRADASTCATLMDRDQVARLAAANLVRIEYPPAFAGLVDAAGYPYCGPRLEGTRLNKARRQSELSNAFWSTGGMTVTDNVGQSAFGTVNADKLAETAANTVHGLSRSFTLAAADKVCWSAVVEAAGRPNIRLYCRSDAEVNGFRGQFTLAGAGTYIPETAQGTGSIIGGGIELLRTGKYRVWLSGTVDPVAVSAVARLLTNNPAGTDSYLGDGVSGIIVSDCQFEIGAFPSSIIKNDGDTDITRAADILTLPVNFGTMALTAYGEILAPYPVAFLPSTEQGVFCLGDNWDTATAEALFLDWFNAGTLNLFHGSNAGVVQSSASPATLTYPIKYAAQLYGDGAVQLHLKGGNGVSVSGAKSAARAFVSSQFKLSKHRLGTREAGALPGHYTHLDHRIHRAVRTLAECEVVP